MIVEIILIVTLLTLLWQFTRILHGKFDNTDVPHKKCFPFIGNFWRSVFKLDTMVDDFLNLYKNVGDERSKFIGAYNFIFPGLMVKDPEVIKQITIKDFDFFIDHQNTFQEELEPVFGKSLIALKGQKWRDMRAALSPVFTSSKMRDMCPFISEVGKQMTEYLESLCGENLKNNGQATVELEMKNLSSRFMADAIASSVFGVEVNSFKDPRNDFLVMGNAINNNFSTIALFKMIFVMMFPWVGKTFNVHIFDEKINSFFRDLVLNSIKYRESNNIVRRDMIQLLMDAKKGNLKREMHVGAEDDAGFATAGESDIGKRDVKTAWEDDELVAQAMIFFLGGFETPSTLTSFILHELGVNPKVQDKLRQEVDENVLQHGLNFKYEMIRNLKYMDMVVSEGLRKWPPNIMIDRLCVKSIDIGPVADGERTSYTVRKGDLVWIPIYCIHRDEKFWPNPLNFDPERFSDDNKHKIIPSTYLPFGSGPRNCIGSRFALMTVKIALYYIIANFKIETCSKTVNPIILDKSSLFMKAENGFWLNFIKRNSSNM